ncbi:hypothetical protein SDC9_159492 [bioreactor metagenome]|uniref:Aldehyde ferredoxin oxidoreductase C-terminal domain-containing protein n=2 Tax=root TaxID=1 RepID=A0A645FDY5_9ZZZZ
MFMAILDSLGICMFTRAAIANEKQLLVDLVNGFTGYDLDVDWLEKVSTETIKDELRFNELAGFTKENYRMPESFMKTKIKSTGDVFDLTEEELDELRL